MDMLSSGNQRVRWVMATINFAMATGRPEDKRKGSGESNSEQIGVRIKRGRQQGGKSRRRATYILQ